MKQGHFHLHASVVSRAVGASAVAAAAYQANQDLLHRGQRCFALSVEHRKLLNKGIVSDELRRAFDEAPLFDVSRVDAETLRGGAVTDGLHAQFEALGVALSAHLKLHGTEDGITLFDKDQRQTYKLHLGEDGARMAHCHVLYLSPFAVAEKLKRGEWLVKDGDRQYRIKEFRVRKTNPETGKREVVQHGLDVYADRLHCYSRKGDVQETWVRVPEHAPDWLQEVAANSDPSPELRAALWNAAEAVEKTRDGRPARRVELALSRELTFAQNKACLERFVEEHFTRHGLVVDVAVHEKKASDGKPNLHAHILISTRAIAEDGAFSDSKSEFFDAKQRIYEWRHGWAKVLNQSFQHLGLEVRVDPRSYAEQGVGKIPGEHLGPERWAMEERGVETEKGDENRGAEHANALQEIAGTHQWLEAGEVEDEPEHEVLNNVPKDVPVLDEKPQPQPHQDTALLASVLATEEHVPPADPETLPAETQARLKAQAQQAEHTAELKHSAASAWRQPVAVIAQRMQRMHAYGQVLLERAKSFTESVFDRYASRAMRSHSRERDLER